jgi:hypothetical protein
MEQKDNESDEQSVKVDRKRQLFVESQNHCALCNSPLDIKVESYLDENFIKEEASCPTCKISTRVKNHRAH